MSSFSPLEKAFPRAERHALRQSLALLDIDKKRFALSILFGSGAIGSGVGLGSVSAWLIARAAQLPPVLDLSVAATSVRMFGIGKAVFRYLQRIASHWVALRGMAAVRTAVYSTMADSTTDVVSGIRRGDLLARTGSDVDELGNVVVKSLLPICVAGIVSLISIAIVASYSPAIAAVLALCLLIAGILGPYCAMLGGRMAEIDQVAYRAQLNTQALSVLEHASELRVSGKLAAAQATQQEIEQRIQHSRDASARPTALATAIDTFAMGISVVAALVIGTQQVAAGTLSPVGLIVCTLTPLSAFEATQGLAKAAVQLVRSGRAALRVMELLETARRAQAPQHDDSPATAEPSLTAHDLVAGWPTRPQVCGPIDLHLEPGKAIAIVGHSGIGKSTLLFTLAGMLAPQSGAVKLSGRDAYRLHRSEVSSELILTAEDAHIFETSVLENLRVARADVSAAEAEELLAQAGLQQWLAQLPDGVNTMLGSDAATISGGERRRLLLARSLASHATFLLLDEPGEHLDPHTADQLIHDLLRAGGDQRGVIVVTHRLSPLAAADEVIMLGKAPDADPAAPAQVIARGTHAHLLHTVPEYAWALRQEQFEEGHYDE
ncbi:MAG: thiol reductant ABC exporter subunit CydC [Actinomycetaceae bacterium]|nr:thiol reductant ABC exporter subunit CydC [Arcanobacterium sp.]MDD7686864.1 thiol reductant ABC exporter subunit CydC [Actinomycetaceae bacterium]MDY5274045.1 thiol reductant ABC exporter subunit CydC [Arcanobacterium sp.]